MDWKKEHDVLLYCEILICQPYKFKERTVERGKTWEEISKYLNTCETAKFRVTKRYVKERLRLIKEMFKHKIPQEETLSRIEVEPTLELKQALEEICSLEESCPVEEKESKQAKGEENKHKLEEIRRKSDGELWSDQINKCGDEAPVEPKKKKRTRGNDSIELRREKSQLQLPVKKRELELKEN